MLAVYCHSSSRLGLQFTWEREAAIAWREVGFLSTTKELFL